MTSILTPTDFVQNSVGTIITDLPFEDFYLKRGNTMETLFSELLAEVKSLRKKVIELKQFVKGYQQTEDPMFKRLKSDPDKLSIKEGLEGRIAALLQGLKISAHLKGYIYLREAIKMVYEDFGMVEGITKTVYPTIARKHNTLPARVERDIRTAIESSWKKKRHHFLFEHYPDNKPTNSQFISMIADRFILEEAELEAVGQS